MHVSLVAAMAANRVIGSGPNIPWRIPGEQKIFRRLTEGKTVLMGRKTFESIGRALPNRTTIVITRQRQFTAPGCHLAISFGEALSIASSLGEELIVAGGAEVFMEAMPTAWRIHLTEIRRDPPGDVHFPPINPTEFKRVSLEEVHAVIPYSYSVYERQA